jgi:glutathione S-transferase
LWQKRFTKAKTWSADLVHLKGLGFLLCGLRLAPFGPMFRPTTPEEFKKISREYLGQRFDWIDKELAGKQYLMGDKFTLADAYMFTVLRWSPRVGINLSKWSNIEAYLDRVAARPKVREAMQAEGLLQ